MRCAVDEQELANLAAMLRNEASLTSVCVQVRKRVKQSGDRMLSSFWDRMFSLWVTVG